MEDKERYPLPFKRIEWQDNEPTGAVGWIIIHQLINNVAGGGLFMCPNATLNEVTELARVMTFKNMLQNPPFGGGKAGIRFDNNHPEAGGVLRRFIAANKEIIKTIWCTGADLNTKNNILQKLIKEEVGVDSGFFCLSRMLSDKYGVKPQDHRLIERLQHKNSPYFTLDESASGYSVKECIKLLSKNIFPRILIQGFGKVGRSLAYYIQHENIGKIVGICDNDGFIHDSEGIDVYILLEEIKKRRSWDQSGILTHLTAEKRTRYAVFPRLQWESDESLLSRFLKHPADIFSPCASRYSITNSIADVLEKETFRNLPTHCKFIISGANSPFFNSEILLRLQKNGVIIVPDWVANAGAALLYMEVLKLENEFADWQFELFKTIGVRVMNFLKENISRCTGSMSTLYQQCEQTIIEKGKL